MGIILTVIPFIILSYVGLWFVTPSIVTVSSSHSGFIIRFLLAGLVVGIINSVLYYFYRFLRTRQLQLDKQSLIKSAVIFGIPIILNLLITSILNFALNPLLPPPNAVLSKYSYGYFGSEATYPSREFNFTLENMSSEEEKVQQMKEAARYYDNYIKEKGGALKASANAYKPTTTCEDAVDVASQSFNNELKDFKNRPDSDTFFHADCILSLGSLLPITYRLTIYRDRGWASF